MRLINLQLGAIVLSAAFVKTGSQIIGLVGCDVADCSANGSNGAGCCHPCECASGRCDNDCLGCSRSYKCVPKQYSGVGGEYCVQNSDCHPQTTCRTVADKSDCTSDTCYCRKYPDGLPCTADEQCLSGNCWGNALCRDRCYCLTDDDCESKRCISNTCQTKIVNGGICTYIKSEQCYSGVCNCLDDIIPCRCVPKTWQGQHGDYCMEHNQCDSGYCFPREHKWGFPYTCDKKRKIGQWCRTDRHCESLNCVREEAGKRCRPEIEVRRLRNRI